MDKLYNDTIDAESYISKPEVIRVRLSVAMMGYRPVPVAGPYMKVKSPGKRPLIEKWQEICATADEAEIRRWSRAEPNCTNTGLLCGDLVGVDIDVLDSEIAETVRRLAVSMLGETPLVRIGKAPKILLCYRADAAFRKMETPELFFADDSKAQIEILADGQQLVAYGIHPDTGKPYSWPDGSPETVHFDDLPVVNSDHLRSFVEEAGRIIRKAGGRTKDEIDGKAAKPAPTGAKRIDFGTPSGDKDFFKEVNRAALGAIEDWLPEIFRSAKQESGTGAWRVTSADLQRPLQEDISVHPVHGGRDFGTGKSVSPIDIVIEHGGATDSKEAALWLCNRMHIDSAVLGWKKGKKEKAKKERKAKAEAADLDGFAKNEDGIALAFADKFKDQLRFCHSTGAWYVWTGSRWRKEETKLAFCWARDLCRELNSDSEDKLAKAATAGAVERFAQSDRAFAVTSEIWDRDSFLLSTPGGTVDLKTGTLRKARPEDFMTKQTAVASADPLHGDGCPMWLAFLKQATKGDQSLIRFMQQIAGYALTGDTREHALFFIYGTGGNGKGVFLNTITKVMGDYATSAAMDTFTASQSDKHPTDFAKLKGARLVTASETEEGRAWAESRIKQMTGGDRISARFMRQDFFEFDPTFKLLIIGNHKPILRNVDDAARRRFNIVPFVHKAEPRDLQLEKKLEAEWPAILRWMIDVCLDWQRNGLVRPASVSKATDEYFNSQDLFGQWLEECCELHPGNDQRLETAADLYASWETFVEGHGEKPGSSKTLGDKLSQRDVGSVQKRHPMNGKNCKMRTGISLVRPPQNWAEDG
jgi:P4 family phage/plasmid primase-like protien